MRSKSSRSVWMPVLLMLSAVLGLTALATPVGAHGDEGTMEVIKTDVVSPTEIEVEVGVVYANDDDLATEANIMVTATGPSGEVVGPINLPVIEDARYGTTITVPGPGAWTLAFTSENPVASTAAAVEVTPEGPPDTTTPTSDAPATSDPEVSVDVTTLETSEPPASVAASATDTEDSNGDDGDGGSIIGYVVVVLAIAGVTTAVVVIRSRRRAGSNGA